jgi:hypothetical protein
MKNPEQFIENVEKSAFNIVKIIAWLAIPVCMIFVGGEWYKGSDVREQSVTYALPPNYKIVSALPANVSAQSLSWETFTNAFWSEEVLIFPEEEGATYITKLGGITFVSPRHTYQELNTGGRKITSFKLVEDGLVTINFKRSWLSIVVFGAVIGLFLKS